MTAPERFELTPGEKSHPLWAKLKAYFEEQLKIQRTRNDGNLSEHETAIIRGDIKRLKALIRLGDDRPLTED